ncbi:alpha/beta hydrolase [Mesorhizobium sp. BAC0120]|uniref:alpha/beta fold hydrolase n=1 Tax=Mesorhizobium sp. BAC0120 TaxID=3090670 RepID=UPI00298BD9AB|nr:alpha/beta hydrolase [Mesorhizobium sp. BAC0120]MDW6026593.1 alpha/beta hydrolase [Mesorhizobium sp. BAC0120]
MRFATFETGEIEINYASCGSPEHPLVICLHGFPEYWAAWSAVMLALASSYHLVAPDQRGYNLSSKPEDVDAYRVGKLVGDLAALADHLSPDRPFVLAGHDWGASVAYAYCFEHPERLTHLVVANGVHPVPFQQAILHNAEQRLASQYINRLRTLDAGSRLSSDGFRLLFELVSEFSDTGWMRNAQRSAYREAWERPGAIEAMLNWYRASPLAVPRPGEAIANAPILDLPAEALKVPCPHLVLWGEEDKALLPACLAGLEGFSSDLTIRRLAGCGHWLLHEKPAEMAAEITEFLTHG